MPGRIVTQCPPMETDRDPFVKGLRWTTEIEAGTQVWLPGNETDNPDLAGTIIFPATAIRKKWFLWSQVDECTARGYVSGCPIQITLTPENVWAMLALPCKASGVLTVKDKEYLITQRYPFAWSTWTEPGIWVVEAVTAYGTVS